MVKIINRKNKHELKSRKDKGEGQVFEKKNLQLSCPSANIMKKQTDVERKVEVTNCNG